MKTNAMRILDKQKISYKVQMYDKKQGISGIDVAKALKQDERQIFKTLVAISGNSLYCFIVPVAGELDLKKAAKVAGVKNIAMLAQKELLGKTGYIHGGCSPVGMKKLLPTFLDESAKDFEHIYVSGGKIGVQISIKPSDLLQVTKGSFADIRKEM